MKRAGVTRTNPDHAVRLAESLYRFATKSKYTDFIIKAADATAHCHSPVLCAQSSYIDGLCAAGVTEAKLTAYQSAEQAKQALQETVRYLYLGTLNLTQDIVEPVLQAAEKIDHGYLKQECETFMVSVLSIQNCPRYIEHAQTFHLAKLSRACEDLQTQKFSVLIHKQWFLPSLTVQDLLRYLMDDHLGISKEDQALDAVSKWLVHSRASDHKKDKYADQLIPHVRLSLCDRKKLESAVSRDNNSVPSHLKVKIYDYLCKQDIRRKEKPRFPTRPQHPREVSYVAVPRRRNPEIRAGTTRPAGASGMSRYLQEQRDETTVIVGGRLAENQSHNELIHLDKQKRSVTFPDAFKYCGDYSVCANDISMYISGGYDTSLKNSMSFVFQYHFLSGEWTELICLPSPREKHGSLVIGHLLYIIGGFCRQEGETNCKRWHREIAVFDLTDPSLITVTTKDIPCEVKDPGVAAVDGEIYVMGGMNSDGVLSNRVVKYQPTIDQWTDCREIPVYSGYVVASAVPVGKRIFLLGHKDFILYDTEHDLWTVLDAPLIPSYWCSMVHLNGKFLAMGGFEDANKPAQAPHNRVQRYDLRTKKWSLLKDTMPVALSYHFSFVVRVPRSS